MTAATALEVPALVEGPEKATTKPRRGRKSEDEKEQGGTQILFFLGEKSSDGLGLILDQKFDSEGLAMVEALKRDVPFYRVEVWKSRAIVKNGTVEIRKEPAPIDSAERRADGFRTTNR